MPRSNATSSSSKSSPSKGLAQRPGSSTNSTAVTSTLKDAAHFPDQLVSTKGLPIKKPRQVPTSTIVRPPTSSLPIRQIRAAPSSGVLGVNTPSPHSEEILSSLIPVPELLVSNPQQDPSASTLRTTLPDVRPPQKQKPTLFPICLLFSSHSHLHQLALRHPFISRCVRGYCPPVGALVLFQISWLPHQTCHFLTP